MLEYIDVLANLRVKICQNWVVWLKFVFRLRLGLKLLEYNNERWWVDDIMPVACISKPTEKH